MSGDAVVVVEHLVKEYPIRGDRHDATLRALDDVSVTVNRGDIVSVVGESGCGKSTLAKILVRLEEPTSGRVEVAGENIQELSREGKRAYPRKIQLVFQDPYGALAPRMSVGSAIEEPLRIHGIGDGESRRRRVSELLSLVGLSAQMASRYPHQLSGGQRQRVNIARALALEPEIIVLDEPVSALDVSIQAQVLNLLRDLQQRLGLTYLFISHDLRVVRYLSHHVAVMYLGNIVEVGPALEVFDQPHHPYTLALLHSIPDHTVDAATDRRIMLRGEVPSPTARPSGCPFHPRCPIARDVCAIERPPLRPVARGIEAACHFAEEVPELVAQDVHSEATR
jgi:oligopeptide transport system ATP-binding protein